MINFLSGCLKQVIHNQLFNICWYINNIEAKIRARSLACLQLPLQPIKEIAICL